jgi:hypothetical protein
METCAGRAPDANFTSVRYLHNIDDHDVIASSSQRSHRVSPPLPMIDNTRRHSATPRSMSPLRRAFRVSQEILQRQ